MQQPEESLKETIVAWLSLHEHHKEHGLPNLGPQSCPSFGLAQEMQDSSDKWLQKRRRAGLALPACSKVNTILRYDKALSLEVSSGMAA